MSNTDKTINTGMQELSPMLCELVDAGMRVKLTVTGASMYPMLHDRADSVVLARADKVKKWDLPLYKRDDGQYVLHRIMRVKNDCYDMCGDNQCVLEKGIRREQIVAVAVEFYRNGKCISCDNLLYRFLAAVWAIMRPIRPPVLRTYVFLRRNLSKRK